MKEKFKLPEQAIRLWFWLFAVLCLIAAIAMPDRGQMVEGMLRLCTLPYQSANSYFDASGGGFAGTFLNAAVVCAICAAIYSLPGSKPDGVSVLAYFLTAGFCFWGITVLNIWFCFAGVLLACLVRKVNPCTQGNVFLFSTGIAPLMTDLLVRYPGAEAHGVTFFGAVLTLAAAVSSFILAAQSGRNPKDSAVRTVVMPICFVGFAVILAADIINTAVHFETAFDAVRIIAELIGAAGHVAAAVIMFKNNMVFIRRNKIAYAVFAAMTGNPASIFVSGAFARERADGECKKLRKAGVIELIVGAVIIVAAYIITNLTLPSDTFRAVTDWLFLCLTLVTDMGLALIAVSTPKDKKKKAKKK